MATPLRRGGAGGALLFGRDAELAQLRDVLVDGGRLVAFITGIPGIGKSALASVFAAEAANLGHAIHCLDGSRLEPTALTPGADSVAV